MTETAASSSQGRPSPETKQPRGNLFARIALFIRQVIGELRKVVTPTRGQWLNYTAVVLVFVVVMMLIVTGLDFAFFSAAKWIFVGTPEQ